MRVWVFLLLAALAAPNAAPAEPRPCCQGQGCCCQEEGSCPCSTKPSAPSDSHAPLPTETVTSSPVFAPEASRDEQLPAIKPQGPDELEREKPVFEVFLAVCNLRC